MNAKRYHMKSIRIVATILFTLAMLLGVTSSPVVADVVEFDISIPNPDISPYAGPYATVEVNRTSNTVSTITFEGLTSGSYAYLMGASGTVGVNVNATTFSVGSIGSANSLSGFSTDAISLGGAANEDGFGSFNMTLDSFDGYGYSSTFVSFVLTNNSGTWASASDVLTDNAEGFLAAAHIFVNPNLTAFNSDTGALATGYAANGGTAVPEPATLLLLGLGLVGIAGVKRKLNK